MLLGCHREACSHLVGSADVSGSFLKKVSTANLRNIM